MFAQTFPTQFSKRKTIENQPIHLVCQCAVGIFYKLKIISLKVTVSQFESTKRRGEAFLVKSQLYKNQILFLFFHHSPTSHSVQFLISCVMSMLGCLHICLFFFLYPCICVLRKISPNTDFIHECRLVAHAHDSLTFQCKGSNIIHWEFTCNSARFFQQFSNLMCDKTK